MHLLSNFVGVGRSEDTNSPDVFQGIRKIVEESGDRVRQTNGREDAWAEERVAAEGVEQGVIGAGEVGVYPR